MKKIIMKLAAVLCCVMTMAVFSACLSESDNPAASSRSVNKGIVINLDSIVIKPYMQFGTSLADVEKYMNKNYADWTYIKEEQGEGVRFSTAYNKGNEIIVFTYNNIPAGSLCAVTYGFYYSEVSFPAIKAELERNGFMYQGKLNFENPEGADEYQMFLNADKSIEVQFARWNNSWAIGFQVFDEDDMNYLVPAN